jgi:hypothetical protein
MDFIYIFFTQKSRLINFFSKILMFVLSQIHLLNENLT